jgi:hypothetical protein
MRLMLHMHAIHHQNSRFHAVWYSLRSEISVSNFVLA